MNSSEILQNIHTALNETGVKNLEFIEEKIIFKTNLLEGLVYDFFGKVAFEIHIKFPIPRTKLNLWSVLNLNVYSAPYGQFYINDKNILCLGGLISADDLKNLGPELSTWAGRWSYEIISTAEAFFHLSNLEFNELPFSEFDISSRIPTFENSELVSGAVEFNIDFVAASFMLERILIESMKNYQVIRMNHAEIAVAGDFISNITIQKIPDFRRHNHLNDWAIWIRTEVGVIKDIDSKLLVKLNRWNSSAFMLSHIIRYKQKNPIVILNSELLPESLQFPSKLKSILHKHQGQSLLTMMELSSDYKIQSMLDFNLGL